MALKPVLIAAVLLAASSAQANSKIYSYVDDQGMRHYTDVPDNNRYRLLVLSSQDRTSAGDRYDAQLLARATQYDSIIEHAAVSSAVEPNLLRAVIVVESGFNSRALSKRGAVGLMQLMPATASRFGVSNPYRPPGKHPRRRALFEILDRPVRSQRPTRLGCIQRGRRGGRSQWRPNSAVHRDHGVCAARAEDLQNARRSNPPDIDLNSRSQQA
jgi:hypothetical protein